METAKNRDGHILRTAEALAPMVRAKYVKDKIGPNAPFFIEALIRANASDLSSNAFRQLFTFLTYADPDGTNAFPSHDTVAAITGYSASTSDRATKELKAAHWIETEQTRRGAAIRTVTIPQTSAQCIAAGHRRREPRNITRDVSWR
jgi:hypothetical protein